MNNNSNADSMPLGLGMALAQNTDAMKYFSDLTPGEQAKIISHVRTINSKNEMHQFVQSLGKQ